MMADNLQLDLDEIIEEKLIKNNLKYPVEKSAGVRKIHRVLEMCHSAVGKSKRKTVK